MRIFNTRWQHERQSARIDCEYTKYAFFQFTLITTFNCETSFYSYYLVYSNCYQFHKIASTNDSVKTIDTIFGSIKRFTKTEFDEIKSIITFGCGGVCLDYDISGAKYVFSIAEWNIQPENIIAAGIRAIPPPLVPGIPAGLLRVL